MPIYSVFQGLMVLYIYIWTIKYIVVSWVSQIMLMMYVEAIISKTLVQLCIYMVVFGTEIAAITL